MNIAKNKKGISLIVLAITVTIIIILTSVVIINSTDNRAMATRTRLIENLNSVEEAVTNYYITYGEFPLPTLYNSAKVLTATDMAVWARNSAITEEIELNGDLNDSFYIINLSKLDLANVSTGNSYNEAADNKPNDVYVVSSERLNAYYLAGVDIKGTKYYSLSSKLTGQSKNDTASLNDSSNSSIRSVLKNGKINVTSAENAFDSTIELDIANGETVEISTTNYSNVINVKLGKNSFVLKDILTDSQKQDLETNLVYVIKINSPTAVVEQKNINITAASDRAPTISDDNTLRFYQEENNISFTITKGDSNISEVRYDLYNVFDSNSQDGYVGYHSEIENVDDLVKYVAKNGKKVSLNSDGVCSISVPKNVRDILVTAQDENGNIAYMSKTLYTFYAKSFLANQTASTTKIKTNVIAPASTKVTLSYSQDNKNYISEQDYQTSKSVDKVELRFKNVTTYNVYVKTVLEIASKKYEYIDKISTLEGISEFAKEQEEIYIGSDKIGKYNYEQTEPIYEGTATYNNPIVPFGFRAVDTDYAKWDDTNSDNIPDGWNDGLVIEDLNENQFVWIPVQNVSNYAKWCITNIAFNDAGIANDSLPTGVSNEITQINKYGGFYIARFEASLPDSKTSDEQLETATFDSSSNNRTDIGAPQSKARKNTMELYQLFNS